MRCAYLVVLVSALAISVESDLDLRYRPTLNLRPVGPNVKVIAENSKEFQDIVNYLNYNLSPRDIHEILDTLPEVLVGLGEADEESDVLARSAGTIVANVFDRIPWGKITSTLQNMAKGNSKYRKVLNLVNDAKFRELVKKAVNSHTLAEFVKGVAEHGFSWTEFLHLLLHALCSTATTIQHDKYSVGVCQILQNL